MRCDASASNELLCCGRVQLRTTSLAVPPEASVPTAPREAIPAARQVSRVGREADPPRVARDTAARSPTSTHWGSKLRRGDRDVLARQDGSYSASLVAARVTTKGPWRWIGRENDFSEAVVDEL